MPEDASATQLQVPVNGNGRVLKVVGLVVAALGLLGAGVGAYASLSNDVGCNRTKIEAAQRERDGIKEDSRAVQTEIRRQLDRIEREQREQRADIKILIRELGKDK